MYALVPDKNNMNEVPAADGAKLDAEAIDRGILQLYLSIPLAGVPLTYTFAFLPLARVRLDVLESSLRDAHDDIHILQTRKLPVISLRMSNDIICDNTNEFEPSIIPWETIVYNSSPSLFTLSDDCRSITVSESGAYIVNVRLTSGTRSIGFSILVNGKDEAELRPYTATKSFQPATLNDVFVLNANDVVSVRIFGPAQAMGNTGAPCSSFTIMHI